jgi:hypothetical protein
MVLKISFINFQPNFQILDIYFFDHLVQIQPLVLFQIIGNDRVHEVLPLQNQLYIIPKPILTYQHLDFLHIQQNHILKQKIFLHPKSL